MKVYAGKDRNMVTIHVTPIQGTVLELFQKVTQIGHNILIYYFGSPKSSLYNISSTGKFQADFNKFYSFEGTWFNSLHEDRIYNTGYRMSKINFCYLLIQNPCEYNISE
jgi:hypothetical protein